MKPNLIFIAFIIALITFWSCRRENEDSRLLIADRIQYDVSLKNSDSAADWWVQNMDGHGRETFVKLIMDKAYSGKYKTYGYFDHKALSAEQVKAIGNRIDTLSVQRATPPYDLYDTIMKTELRLGDILRVRFLEAWYWNEATNQMDKEVTGICPLLENYTETGEFRGNQPLFWVALSDKFPFKDNNNK
jgi:hypothetical protein